MSPTAPELPATLEIPRAGLQRLLDELRRRDYETWAPVARDGALVIAQIEHAEELPYGKLSEQDGGHYRITENGHPRAFDITPGADGWKRFLFPPRQAIFNLDRHNGPWGLEPHQAPPPRRALIGVRPCDLAAILIQDRVFLRSNYPDPVYLARRQRVLLIAVNCLHPGDTCFCASVNAGPAASQGFDLCLTELDDSFLVQVGSELGADLAAALQAQPAAPDSLGRGERGLAEARAGMGRRLDTAHLADRMLSNLNHPQWDAIATRCLGCGSCTLVCPTCFCWDAVETIDIAAGKVGRERMWDSCFNPDHSYHAGGGTRQTIAARYRQWLTHKLGSWVEQFGTLGCVGCGRCITWCPAGIDLTVETLAFRAEAVQ
jgi:sulfhydrogenase subunit beta (sulfur reductase)